MQIKGKFLASRLGRRLFMIFCFCSLVPLLLMAVTAFTQVKMQLKEQGERNLQQTTKSLGMTIYERMILLGSELDGIANALPNSPPEELKFWNNIEDRFFTLVYNKNSEQSQRLLHTNNSRPIPIDYPAFRSKPEKISVVIHKDRPCSRIFMVRPINYGQPEQGFLLGEINTSYLWKIGSSNILPPLTDLCVLDQEGNIIISSLGSLGSFIQQAPFALDSSRSRQFEWSADGEIYLARYWTVFMESRFFSDNWTVVLSKSKQDLFASVHAFQKFFPLIVMLTFFVVVLLSMVNIRLILDPLEKLKTGIQKISNNDFKNQIRVNSRDEFEVVADAFNNMASELDRRFQAIHTISEVDRAILSSLEPEVIISKMFGGMQELLSCSAIAIHLADPENSARATRYVSSQARENAGNNAPIFFDTEDIVARLSGQAYMHFHRSDDIPGYLRPFARDVEQWIVLPVFIQDKLVATLNLGYSADIQEFDQDFHQASQMADQMAVALAKSNLVRELDQLNEGALMALARTVDAKSPWTAGHSERVSWMAQQLAGVLELENQQFDILHRAALLHDIGKVGISNEILDKPEKLTDEEYAIIKEHPRMGARILEPIKVYHEVIPVVLQHHEKFDGKGYPAGLSGEDIVQEARILSVADAYDALIFDRPYRPGWKHSAVVDFILNNSGSHFDPRVVRAFEYLLGTEDFHPMRMTAPIVEKNKNTATI